MNRNLNSKIFQLSHENFLTENLHFKIVLVITNTRFIYEI